MTLGHTTRTGDALALSSADLTEHCRITGKTRVGKSTLLEAMFLQIAHADAGGCFIDPHGDSINTILDYIPEHRINDVVLFDPGDPQYRFAWNLLANAPKDPDEQVALAERVTAGFMNVWRLDGDIATVVYQTFHDSVHALIEHGVASKDENPSMADIPNLLLNEHYRQRVLTSTQNRVAKRYWEAMYKEAPERIASTYSRVERLIKKPLMQHIIGASSNALPTRKLMDDGKLLLVNLSKGKLGAEAAKFLGGLLVEEIKNAAFSRADSAQDERRWFGLVIDEFQTFGTTVWPEILSETGKFGLSLTVGHQFLDQLDDDTAAALLGNVGHQISFRLGVTDAKALHEELDCGQPAELIDLDKYHAIVRRKVNGAVDRKWKLKTAPLDTYFQWVGKAETIKYQSQRAYCNSKEKAEAWRVICDRTDTAAPHRLAQRQGKKRRSKSQPQGGKKRSVEALRKKLRDDMAIDIS